MTIFSKTKLTLFAIFLSGCAGIPPFPAVWQCLYRHDKGAFYCVNTETKTQLKVPLDSADMKAAQCVSADDFKKVQSWISTVKDIAEKRCH